MNGVIRFLTDYRGPLTDDTHFDQAGSIVERYSVSICSLLVDAGVAEWVEDDSALSLAPATDLAVADVKPKRGRKPKAVAE